ncbi:hypothetical protein [Brucella intermedia]|uniref:hypothetical protein n=1 Tax=Brucella intermedia TaxID=94625 RepID=UPI0012D2C6EA|nr:hypothetical protein [Brucella intermedia]
MSEKPAAGQWCLLRMEIHRSWCRTSNGTSFGTITSFTDDIGILREKTEQTQLNLFSCENPSLEETHSHISSCAIHVKNAPLPESNGALKAILRIISEKSFFAEPNFGRFKISSRKFLVIKIRFAQAEKSVGQCATSSKNDYCSWRN